MQQDYRVSYVVNDDDGEVTAVFLDSAAENSPGWLTGYSEADKFHPVSTLWVTRQTQASADQARMLHADLYAAYATPTTRAGDTRTLVMTDLPAVL